MRTVNLFALFIVKDQSNEIFEIFHHLNQPGPLTNGFKIFFLFKFLLSYSNICIIKTYFPGYDIPGSPKNFIFSKNEKCSPLLLVFCDTVPLRACAKVLRNGS